MKILLTGGSGFLGKVFTEVLTDDEIISLARTSSTITVDLSQEVPLLPAVDLVIHAAGKAHTVPKKEASKQEFFNVNVRGTENLLKGLEGASALPQSFIFISSVAVYGKAKGALINESEPLLAQDPYGLSKIEAEQLVAKWCEKNGVKCTILRLPLIAGYQPLGNLGAMIKGIARGYYFEIAGGNAKKSIVMASDVAQIVHKAAQVGGIYNLTDGYHPTFRELSGLIAKQMNKPKPKNIPLVVVQVMAKIGDLFGSSAPINTIKLIKMTSDLTFDDTLAKEKLNWKPRLVLKEFKLV
jgi:nucleoside-diphosphate-sugar epimerase